MKRLSHILPFLLLFLMAACSNDGDDGGYPEGRNDNKNVASPRNFASESKLPASSFIGSLEVPALRSHSADYLLVHTLADGRANYCIEYDTQLKAARWTAYKSYSGFSSNDTHFSRNAWKNGEYFNGFGGSEDPFQPDLLLPAGLQRTLEDHRSNGYDRGHMIGSADRLNSKEANGQTYYLTNIHPQLNQLNAKDGLWYNLENKVRNYDQDMFRDTLYVVKGGTISDGNYTTIKNGVPCPKYFFMAILAFNKSKVKINGGYKAIAFWVEHKNTVRQPSVSDAISIDELESRTGIDFFCNLPDNIESVVEERYYKDDWNLK